MFDRRHTSRLAVMGSEPPSEWRGAWPPPSPSRYRSKACLGAMFHAKSFEEAGAPPICVGLSYRSTAKMPPTDLAANHGQFKFTCVGYGQRAIDGGASTSGASTSGPSTRRLPYCEGLQILVADATSGTSGIVSSTKHNSQPPIYPVAAAALVRDLETLRRARDDAVIALRELSVTRPDDTESIEKLEREARQKELALRKRVIEARRVAKDAMEQRGRNYDSSQRGSSTESSDTTESSNTTSTSSEKSESHGNSTNPTFAERLRGGRPSIAPEGSVRRLVEGDKGPGVVFPSAEFEEKFIKSAGKIFKNMKKHAGYVGKLVAAGPGGMGGIGGI